MEIFKEDYANCNLMFTEHFKNSTMSISEFLSNPNYYKVMWRSNTTICLRICKMEDKFIVLANVLDTLNGRWITLDYKENCDLYKAMMELNGLKDTKNINEESIKKITSYFEKQEVSVIDFRNSEKENKISARARLNAECINKNEIVEVISEVANDLGNRKFNVKK